MLRISTEIGSISKFKNTGDFKALELLAKAGFDCYDYSMDKVYVFDFKKRFFYPITHPLGKFGWKNYAKRLRSQADKLNLKCNQMHAPFPITFKEHKRWIIRSFKVAKILGTEVCVIHPEDIRNTYSNVDFYKKILKIAKKYNLKIACENMWVWNNELDHIEKAACSTPNEFAGLIDAINDPNFGACVDVGHAEMKGSNTSAKEMIEVLGERVIALHLHDNDKWKDSHEIPFTMNINFDDICSSLKKINYKHDLTLEALNHFNFNPNEKIEDGVEKMANAIKKIASMLD